MDKKYWFIKYTIECELWTIIGKVQHHQCVSDEHPFEWLAFLRKLSSFKRELVSWKEITKEEYLKGKEVFGIG